MKKLTIVACLVFAFAGVAVAHTGVKNAAVKARMDVMSGIGGEVKTLGQMANGTVTFDRDAARAAAAIIAGYAASTPDLFNAQEDDPMSEAKADIWTNFDDFVGKARDLEVLAVGLSSSIEDSADLEVAMKSLGANCLSCHKAYRD